MSVSLIIKCNHNEKNVSCIRHISTIYICYYAKNIFYKLHVLQSHELYMYNVRLALLNSREIQVFVCYMTDLATFEILPWSVFMTTCT